MVSLGFILGLAALLAVPGPTNTLLATAGATDGLRSAPRLLAAELLAYLTAVSTLGLLLAPLMVALPQLGTVLQGMAVLYLLHTAWRLWGARTRLAQGPVVTPRQITLTTLMNPKSLVIAFGLMPQGWNLNGSVALTHLGTIALLTPLIGGMWILLGRFGALSLGPRAMRGVPKFSAIALGAFALLLARSAFAG